MTSLADLSTNSPIDQEQNLPSEFESDEETASIDLNSTPAVSARNSVQSDEPKFLAHLRNSEAYGASDTSTVSSYEFNTDSKRESRPYTFDTEFSSVADDASYTSKDLNDSPNTSTRDSMFNEPKENPTLSPTTYPPRKQSDTESIAESFASGSSRKARPESILLEPPPGKLVLGIALVDFNHLVRRNSVLRIYPLIYPRSVQGLNGARVKYLKTRKSSKWYRFSPSQMALTWYVAVLIHSFMLIIQF